ncbi:MAG: HAMP domain-containing sensor histidine kinase [Bacteroidota bacterium]
MKLLNKTTKLYLSIAIPVFIVCACIFYYLLVWIITAKVEESLLAEKEEVTSQLKESESIPSNLMKEYHIKEISKNRYIQDQFRNISIYDPIEEEEEPYRQLYGSIMVKGEFYEIIISRSLVESDDLIYGIIIIGVLLFGLLTLCFVIINRRISKSLWDPFYDILNKLKRYKLDDKREIAFNDTAIEEFNELNKVAGDMMFRIQNDYKNQKQFIDNVSHEIQTPLAVINATLEELIQYDNLTKKEMELIQSVNDTAAQLSKLNKSILLLSKIENRQFTDVENVKLISLIEDVSDGYTEQINSKYIKLSKEFKEPLEIQMSPVLAEILINNLIQNSVRHNIKSGLINIKMVDSTLEIANTGEGLEAPAELMFEKFAKQSKAEDSTGLGLSIVKQICDLYGFGVTYEVKGHIHVLKVSFNAGDYE